LPLANRFSQLPHVELAGEVHQDIGGGITYPPARGASLSEAPEATPETGDAPCG